MPLGVEILSLLRLEEFGSNRQRRTIPPHPAHDVGRAGLLLPPASRKQLVGKVKPAPTRGYAVVATQGHLRGIPPYMKIQALEHTWKPLAEKDFGR